MSARSEHQKELLISQIDVVLEGLPPAALRDLARNDAASPLWRIAATEKLRRDNHPYANHPDLAELVWCIENNEKFPPAKDKLAENVTKTPQIQELDKTEVEINGKSMPAKGSPFKSSIDNFPGPTVEDIELHADETDAEPATEPGPFTASVTTKTLFGN